MEKEKYYTPTIEEFHVGFEYEQKESFGDGTVKTKEDFDNANWIKKYMEIGELPYVERMLNGRNALNGICGIRVKYLDKQDIESFGFEEDKKVKGVFDHVSERFYITCDYWLNKDNYNFMKVRIEDEESEYSFSGTIKNKSELIKLIQQLNIK